MNYNPKEADKTSAKKHADMNTINVGLKLVI